jgi:hypothetical protein
MGYCVFCGTPLNLQPGVKFCGSCGKPVNQTNAQAPQNPVSSTPSNPTPFRPSGSLWPEPENGVSPGPNALAKIDPYPYGNPNAGYTQNPYSYNQYQNSQYYQHFAGQYPPPGFNAAPPPPPPSMGQTGMFPYAHTIYAPYTPNPQLEIARRRKTLNEAKELALWATGSTVAFSGFMAVFVAYSSYSAGRFIGSAIPAIIFGAIASSVVEKYPKAGAALLFIGMFLSLIAAPMGWIGAILLLIAAIKAVSTKDNPFSI